MLATSPAPAACPGCAWTGPRTKRGPLPAHKGLATAHAPRRGAPAGRTTGQPCGGPAADRAIASALGAAFYAAGRAPMPDPTTLSMTLPIPGGAWAREIYLACLAAPWARFLVIVHAPLEHDPNETGRCSVYQVFADREAAERWGHACALALGPAVAGARYLGYVSLCAMDRRMRRWEAFAARTWDRNACGLESPVAYAAIDPGDVPVRYTDPACYPGYGDTPPRDMWDRVR